MARSKTRRGGGGSGGAARRPKKYRIANFVAGYVQAALETTTVEGEILADHFDREDIAPEALLQILIECQDFLIQTAGDISPDSDVAGEDFWLTRNDLTPGFLGGDWAEPYASKYARIAQSFGRSTFVLGDDDMLYVHPAKKVN